MSSANRNVIRSDLHSPEGFVLTKQIDFDHMRVFSGYPETNSVHTDRGVARQRGLPDAIAQGLQTYAYMCEWLVAYFGERWWTSGNLSVSFLNIVVPGDVVHTRARLAEDGNEPDTSLVRLEIWCETDSGTKVAAGFASANAT